MNTNDQLLRDIVDQLRGFYTVKKGEDFDIKAFIGFTEGVATCIGYGWPKKDAPDVVPATPSTKTVIEKDPHDTDSVPQRVFIGVLPVGSLTNSEIEYLRVNVERTHSIYFILPRNLLSKTKRDGGTMCKGGSFFVSQGGLKEAWGNKWWPVWAADMDDARMQGPVIIERFPEMVA